jgi:gamma-glutamylaminecyclotransferase
MGKLTTVFVYGTLKRGCRNHSAMRGAEFFREAETEPAYLLVNCGAYPGLIHAKAGNTGLSIRGELYRVDQARLAELDRFEDVPNE